MAPPNRIDGSNSGSGDVGPDRLGVAVSPPLAKELGAHDPWWSGFTLNRIFGGDNGVRIPRIAIALPDGGPAPGGAATGGAPDRWVTPVLWAQTFRSAPVYSGQPSVVHLSQLNGILARSALSIERSISGVDYRPVIGSLAQELFQDSGSHDSTFWLDLFAATERGEHTYLSTVLEGLVATSFLRNHQAELRPGQDRDITQTYVPLWYALNHARDAVANAPGRGAYQLRRHFDQSLRALNKFYAQTVEYRPPRLNWRVVRELDAPKAGKAFLYDRPKLQQGIKGIPSDYGMVTYQAPGTLEEQRTKGADQERELSADQQRAIREQVTGLVEEWGIPRHKSGELINAMMRRVGLIHRGAQPGHSLAQGYHTLFWFVADMVAIIGAIGVDRVLGSTKMEHFNQSLAKRASMIIGVTGWSPRIDVQSIMALVRALMLREVQDRHVIATSTHESWMDITAIAALLGKLGIRFTYKKELGYVPLLGQILRGTRMPQMDRVKLTGDPDVDGMGRALAYLQVDRVKHDRLTDGALNLAFTPGTRSKVGGVGVPKKGDANQAIDGDAPILVITLFGTGQIKPTSWGEILYKKGIGNNREVLLRMDIIDPRDFEPTGVFQDEDSKRRIWVHALTDAIFEVQVADHLGMVQEVRERAADTALSDGERQTARIQFNEFIRPYITAFIHIRNGDDALLEKWCRKNKVDSCYVQRLHGALPDHEVRAMISALKLPSGGIAKNFLPASLYTSAESKRLRSAHLSVGIVGSVIGAALARAGSLRAALNAQPGDGTVARVIKGLLKAVATVTGPIESRFRYSVLPRAVEELIPQSARLEPVDREVLVQALTAFLNDHEVEELPDAVSRAIDKAYQGAEPDTIGQFKAYALAYLRFIRNDAERFLSLLAQDVPINDQAVVKARERATSSFQDVRWNGAPLNEYVFAAIRDREEAHALLQPRKNYATRLLFRELEDAEAHLKVMLDQHGDGGHPEVVDARNTVRGAFEAYAELEGLAASHETFSYLPEHGLSLHPELFDYILSKHIGRIPVDCYTVGVYEALQGLWNHRDADKAVLTAEQTKFSRAMRDFLDQPGRARLLQAELLRIQSNRNAMAHNPLQLILPVIQRVREMARGTTFAPEVGRFELAIASYLAVVRQAVPNYQLGDALQLEGMGRGRVMAIEQARQQVNEATQALLSSRSGFARADGLSIDLARASKGMTGLDEALASHHEYWTVRRHWAGQERGRQEALLPKVIGYFQQRDEILAQYFRSESELIWHAATEMMAEAQRMLQERTAQVERAPSKSSAEREAQREALNALRTGLSQFEGLYLAGTKRRQGAISHRIFDTPDENYAGQVGLQQRHMEAVAGGDLDGSHGNGHSVHLNRAMETVAQSTAEMFYAAARAHALVSGGTTIPNLVAFQTAAVHAKLRPELDPAIQAEYGASTRRYMLEGVLPVLAEGLWRIGRGLPTDQLNAVIQRWGQWTSFNFHDIGIDDRRAPSRLPGASRLTSGDHTGTWFGDYSLAMALDPRRAPILLSKGGLDKLLPEPMGTGALLIANFLPEEGGEIAAEAMVVGMLLSGLHTETPVGTMTRLGSQDVTLWEALTMSVASEPDINHVVRPEELLSDPWITGRDLRGIGRSRGSALGAAAVSGSMARVPYVELYVNHGGGEIGPKPDKMVRIRPGRMDVTVQEFDPLVMPEGAELIPDGSVPGPWMTRQAAAFMNHWRRQRMSFESSVRRSGLNGTVDGSSGPGTPRSPRYDQGEGGSTVPRARAVARTQAQAASSAPVRNDPPLRIVDQEMPMSQEAATGFTIVSQGPVEPPPADANSGAGINAGGRSLVSHHGAVPPAALARSRVVTIRGLVR